MTWDALKTGAFPGAFLLLAAGAFVAGRYTAPTKVTEKTVEVADQKAIAAAVAFVRAEWKRDTSDKTTTRVIYKDGKPAERIVYRDRESHAGGSSEAATQTTTTTTAHVEKTAEKTVEAYRPDWRAQASWSLTAPDLVPNRLDGARRIFGPAWLGGYAHTRGPFEVGLTLALEF